MLGKKMGSVKKLAKKKVKVMGGAEHECLLMGAECCGGDEESSSGKTPTGFLAIYVGEERRRFVVPTGYLSHPLFKMLLEKAYDEFGFDQRNGLVVPCSVEAFQEVVAAVESCHGRFDLGKLMEEFL
ncbi:auxin-induced protein X15-like [Diospyros lotus]|uniref:auxin-induced protein X15-like n=1 Tax=Diospyros lotus TaxID=55363 RepID=UPI00225B35FA|nr:auxin-induced protein X15-like [Diospyros lotus]